MLQSSEQLRQLAVVTAALAGMMVATATIIPGASSTNAKPKEDLALPAGKGREIAYGRCRTCHSLTYLTDSAGIDRADWDSVLKSMRQLGMPAINGKDRKVLLDYLASYLGPHPQPAAPAAPSKKGTTTTEVATIDGRSVFDQQCASCHQTNGQGVPKQFPPLAGNKDLFLSRDLPALIVLNGLSGKVTVKGQIFNGTMPPFDYLSDAKIAAVVRYIRNAWGNDRLLPKTVQPLDAEDVGKARRSKLDAAAVAKRRSQLN